VKRALTLLTAAVLGAGLLPARATTAPTLTLTQQAKKADVIVRATLGLAKSVKEGDVTWMVYPLTVTETVAGDTASLPQTEGKPALYVLAGLEDGPVLRTGQEAFFLLYARRLDSPIVGFTQGVYPIENGRVTRLGTSAVADAGSTASTVATPGATVSGSSNTASPGSVGATTASTSTATNTTTTSTSTAGSGATSPAGPSGTASGTGAGTASSTTTPSPSGASAPGVTGPGTAPGTVVSPPAPTPAADPLGDPAKFRDALRAAREAK